MNKDSRHVGFRVSLGVVVLTLVAALIGSGGSQAGSQANMVRVVSPADLVLQPTDPDTGIARLEFEFGPAVSYVTLQDQPPPIKLSATAKTLSWGVCGLGERRLLPGDKVPLHYDAFDSAGAKIGSGSWEFTIGPDKTKPTARIVSPKNNSFVGPGESVEVVVAGEESKSAPTWQTGIHRLTLVDAAAYLEKSDESPPSACAAKQWTKQYPFRYVVPRDATSGQIITLKAAAEDGAKNIGFSSQLNLIVQKGYAGLWTTKGSFKTNGTELTYTIEAVFSFTLNLRSGAVECGTKSEPYCGSANITFDPGHAKDCVVTRTPSFSVFKIMASGVLKGKELTMLTIRISGPLPATGYRFDCQGKRFDTPGRIDVPVGSIWEEGITIAIPLRDNTTITKHESHVISGGSADVDHHVEIYAPQQNR